MLLGELRGKLTRADLGHQVRQGFADPRAFMRDLGADDHEEDHDEGDQQGVDNGDGADTAYREDASRRLHTSDSIR